MTPQRLLCNGRKKWGNERIRRRPGEERRLTWDFHVPIRKVKVLIKICHNFHRLSLWDSWAVTSRTVLFSHRGREAVRNGITNSWVLTSASCLSMCGNTDDGISSEVGIVDPGLVGVWRIYEPPNRKMTVNGPCNTTAHVLSGTAWSVNNSSLLPWAFFKFSIAHKVQLFDCHNVFKFFSKSLQFSSALPVSLNCIKLCRDCDKSLIMLTLIMLYAHAVEPFQTIQAWHPHSSQLLTLPLKTIWICGLITMFRSNSTQHALVDVARLGPATHTDHGELLGPLSGHWLTYCTLWPPLHHWDFMQHIHPRTPAC